MMVDLRLGGVVCFRFRWEGKEYSVTKGRKADAGGMVVTLRFRHVAEVELKEGSKNVL